jgi:hypothetical protein
MYANYNEYRAIIGIIRVHSRNSRLNSDLISVREALIYSDLTTKSTETTRKETAILCPFRVFPWFVLRDVV